MKRFLLIFSVLVSAFNISHADNKIKKAEQDTQYWNYEVETTAKNNKGGYILKVWSYSKDPNVAEEQSKKNAIHAVVFKGVPEGTGTVRTPGIKALIPDDSSRPDDEFFSDFFAYGGDYMRYVTVSNNGFSDVVKLAKKKKDGTDKKSVYKFKVGLTVTVDVPALRKYLESKGKIKALSAGFN